MKVRARVADLCFSDATAAAHQNHQKIQSVKSAARNSKLRLQLNLVKNRLF